VKPRLWLSTASADEDQADDSLARWADAQARSWFAPARGALQPPIRAELFGTLGFAGHGHALAREHGQTAQFRRTAPFFPRLRENVTVLHEAYRYIADRERAHRHIGPAGEWLLDNIHLVVAQTKEVHDGLPRRYFRSLPVLASAGLGGLPRVYAIAWAYVSHADSAFEPAMLVEFLRAYQEVHALTQGELWALPTTLRVVLVENLRRLAERVATEAAARDTAHALCDGLSAATGDAVLQLFERLSKRGVSCAFALQVMQRLHAASETGDEQGAQHRETIRVALASELPELALAQASQQAQQAADNMSVSNAIRSLQLLDSADWRGLIAQSSRLMQQMLRIPAFAAERDDTQDTTLHEIERLARRSRRTEADVASIVSGLAQAPSGSQRESCPGYWLSGAGTARLHKALGLPGPGLPGIGRLLNRQTALPALIGLMVLATLGLSWAFVSFAATAGASRTQLIIAALLALWPASEIVTAAVHRLISESVPPRRLPRLSMIDGITADQRVLVVIPAMLVDAAGVRALASQLERHYLANREEHAQFALLTDFTDADSAHLDSDAALLGAAQAAIDALQTRHPSAPGAPRRFLLLHRDRRWSISEQRWIGWERKRGKLEQLVALLSAPRPGAGKRRSSQVGAAAEQATPSAFLDLGASSQHCPATPYVVTLDSDTVLPPGALRELVAIAAHPLNQPILDRRHSRVIAGHGILQPRIVAAWPQPGEATWFHRLFADARGSDPYNASASDVYQDLFDEGSFTGKGLMNVAAVHAVLAGRLPEGQVLSHDLLEGCIARCGSVSDVALLEPAPSHADVAASRTHRWTRGDWQLMPLLLQSRRYALRGIDHWKLFDNMRRSLVAPVAGVLLLFALASGAFSAWATLALALAAFGTGPLLGAVAGLAPSRDDLALRHFARQALGELARAGAGLVWQLALWLRQSVLIIDAVMRATWRSAYSRRQLLQWTTAAAADNAVLRGWRPLLRQHWPITLLALALAIGLLALGTTTPWLAISLCTLWAATPLWIAISSRAPPPDGALAMTRSDEDYLRGVARETWDWFAANVGEHSNHLPPDNVQTVPHVMVAQRTSPTNIGLYLLAVACARAFGWITPEQLAGRLAATLDTLDLLPRVRGHFLNWTDTQTLQPLLPAYVSTVDSGNLCGHLLAVAGACDELVAELQAITLADGSDARSQCDAQCSPLPSSLQSSLPSSPQSSLQLSLRTIASRCRALAEAPEFGFLYNRRRRLLHIGWRVAEQQLDPGHYDLLASESRLASLWAIAKGELPAAHWAALGRPFQATGEEVGLRSWSGSMFEYLMPALVLDEPAGSALASASHMAVQEQRAFGAHFDLPWGVSESAYAVADRTLAYQYAPQGVPRLALRRTPADERVIAPYASALAAMLEPRAAVANLRALEARSARGEGGFIEALDFTADRQSEGSHGIQVSTYMAHHQGMTLVALANVLLQARPRRWGMADARIAAVASLLQERVPREVSPVRDPAPGMTRGPSAPRPNSSARDVLPGEHALQRTQLISNGTYSVALRANGAGWSRRGKIDITRWRDDALRDVYGSFIYLRRARQSALVSITQHPAPDAKAHYAAQFHTDRVCLEATWPDLRSRCTVWVSPEDDIELRRVELWNTSDAPIELELFSAWDVCLSEARADEMHPAFANMFISAQWDAPMRALYLARKPRRDHEVSLHAVHFLAQVDASVSEVRALADRSHWLGRRREPWQPRAQFDDRETASGTCATGLDPVAALSMRILLPAHGTAQCTLATAAANEHSALQALVDRYHQGAGVERASQLSATVAALRRHDTQLAADELVAAQTLTTLLVLLHSRPTAALAQGKPPTPVSRRALWRFGLSGDFPMIVVTVSAEHGLRLVRALTQALLRWSWCGVACDLVLINAEPESYLQPLQRELLALRERHTSQSRAGDVGGLYLLRQSELSAEERATLALLARVRFAADGRALAEHVSDLIAWHDSARLQRIAPHRAQPRAGPDSTNALDTPDAPDAPVAVHASPQPDPGAFDPTNGHYRFTTSQTSPTPRPWVNVLANAKFGALVSEAGAGCTWAENSRLQQLTAWSNDALTDNSGEAFLLQRIETGELWHLSAGGSNAACRVEHGPGSTRISQRFGQLEIELIWTVDTDRAIKRVQVHLFNDSAQAQTLRVIGLFEWLLGAIRVDRQSIHTRFDSQRPDDGTASVDVLLATQLDDHDSAGGLSAFITVLGDAGASRAIQDWTCDRRELFDEAGHRVVPDRLGCRSGSGLDACAALSIPLALAPGQRAGCLFLLGSARSAQAALDLARESVREEYGGRPQDIVADRLGALLGSVSVQTPDPLFDALVNHWLLYQATVCRLWGRAGFYQAGGAFGFRDQLQDAMALATSAPQLLRAHLLRAAARQFEQGDVQHWWHPHTGAGVRTRFSDDLLWLPHAAVHYVAATGDTAVLDEVVPFIEGAEVPAQAEDAYYVPRISERSAALYEHCARTLDRSLGVGIHGLPLMGTGDWNDGMNRVGSEGRGESVWLGWFLCRVATDFAPFAALRGEQSRAQRWLTAVDGWRAALNDTAWDGDWFARAFFDDGTPLGSHLGSECRIDLIAQAWSVLSDAGLPARQTIAMDSAERLLGDPALGLLRLLDPPLVAARPDAGYIQAYPPGVRENGGQYNHGAVWAVMAWAKLGNAEAAWRTWMACSPAHRAAHPVHGIVYGLEPYAVAADVYSQPPYAGRGGWSWYTGSAAGMHRAAIESICGLQVRAGRVRLQPALPAHWPGARITLRRDGRVHDFSLCAADADQSIRTALAEGAVPLLPGVWLELAGQGALSHHLVVLGGAAATGP